MKSKLFSKNTYLESENFIKDFKKLVSLDEVVLRGLPDVVVDVHLANTNEDAGDIYSSAAIQLGIDESKLRANFNLAGLLIRELSPEGDGADDTVSDVVSDLITSNAIDRSEMAKATSFVESVRQVAKEKFHAGEKKKEYQNSGMPTLVGITGTVNLRGVFDAPYSSDKDINSYNPKCEGLIPVATLKLRLDSDSPIENIFFQMTSREVKMVKDHLQSLELQMKKTIEFVKDGVI